MRQGAILETDPLAPVGPLCVRAKSLQSCPTLCDPMDCTHKAPLSLGFSRQDYWRGLPRPPPRESFLPKDWTLISYVFYIGRRVLYHKRKAVSVGPIIRSFSYSLISWMFFKHVFFSQSTKILRYHIITKLIQCRLLWRNSQCDRREKYKQIYIK